MDPVVIGHSGHLPRCGPTTPDEHMVSSHPCPCWRVFTPADHAALFGPWSWLGTVAGQALATGQGGMVDDDLAYVTPWGCDLRQISAPVLFVHGAQDRLVPSSHATWLAQRCRTAELWLRPEDGHVSILNSSAMALDWLREHGSHR